MVGTFTEPLAGHPPNLRPLARMDRLQGVTTCAAGEQRLDLTEDQDIVIAGNDVESHPKRVPEVALEDS